MQLSLCRHIKTNGPRCEAPSLTDGHLVLLPPSPPPAATPPSAPPRPPRGYLVPDNTSNSPPSRTANPFRSLSPSSLTPTPTHYLSRRLTLKVEILPPRRIRTADHPHDVPRGV